MIVRWRILNIDWMHMWLFSRCLYNCYAHAIRTQLQTSARQLFKVPR